MNCFITCLIIFQITDDTLFSAAPITDANITYIKDYAITMPEVLLEYETLELPNAEHMSTMKLLTQKGKNIIYLDLPRLSFTTMPPRDTICRHQFNVSAGARYGTIAFIMSHSLIAEKASKRPCSTKFFFPSTLKNISVTMDSDELVFSGGLENINSFNNAISSVSARQHYHYNLKHGLTTKPWRKIYNNESRSYDDQIQLNFSNYVFDKERQIHVVTTFAHPYIPEGVQMVYCEVSQYKICNDGINNNYTIHPVPNG